MAPHGVWDKGARLSVLVVVFCSILIPSPTEAYIYAHYSNMTSMLFEDLPALFGAPLPKDGLMAVLIVSHPPNGCTPIDPPPPLPPSFDANTTKFIALIRRYECNFDIKVLHAQQAGYSAAIVHNMYSDKLLNMNYSNDTIAEEIDIPSVFTSYYASQILRNFIIPEHGAYVILKPEFTFPLSYYLIPFTGVVGMIIIVMCVVLMIRCAQYRKRMRRNRLSKEQLKRIPTHRFCKAYHCKCVDPWLTQTKKTCPVCKQRVTRNNTEHSESESEEETGGRGRGDGAGGDADTERTPLLRPSNPGSPSGSPGAYSATTTAQCLASPAHCDSPIMGYEGCAASPPLHDSPVMGYEGCAASPPLHDSPVMGYEGYYSHPEDTDSESDGVGEYRHHTDDDTTQLIGRDGVEI
ncbi:E3 ubiquitin-protein ligase RNF167 [Liparis tanakae]|uniref:RING-type E3 ubiquitin transferase n=1 Tax=Liparis tanakae TaxID=230148 RepID=A0A4Z2I4S5_9TELE|nr:E3 ubiquitin-protein ligase RNF167 [Liparis tanakae]